MDWIVNNIQLIQNLIYLLDNIKKYAIQPSNFYNT